MSRCSVSGSKPAFGPAFVVALALATGVGVLNAQTSAVPTNIPYADAKSVLDVLRDNLLPPELRSAAPAAREAVWPAWVSRRDQEIRARLARADEDSLLNLLLLGTTFTRHPRVTDLAALRAPDAAAAMLAGRVDDLVGALSGPGGDERIRFARGVIAGTGTTVETPAGRRQAREYLFAILARVTRETEEFARTVAAMSQLDDPVAKLALDATNYRDRGLSSDTSIVPNFAIDQALQDLRTAGRLRPGTVRRVAVVGPGLDVIDRREGYDFYPVQTIQPFAVIDSLMRLGLAVRDQLHVTTFDVSPKVNGHLDAARRRADGGDGYIIQLPLGSHERWRAELIAYWERFGKSVGDDADAAAPPANSGVRVRAIQVRPEVLRSVVPQDLNIVLQRLDGLAPAERFDLVVATNIFIYYDVFEQSLALANVARMLRPGGLLLSNTLVPELPGLPMTLVTHTDVVYTETAVGDRILCYERAR
ncbi:MAG: class I SAM-dependent methyltransferase [Acidobacteria bacterium]|nr:class I SAM-dependent methyltransferase [Acidobacteriota bacterium]